MTSGVVLKDDSGALHPGEKDITCERGHTHHGQYGAAGLLIRHKGGDGKLRYLLQKRSVTEDDPGTWSIPGGAALEGESAHDAAWREAQEEMGALPPGIEVHHHVVDDHGNWAFTTLVCDTPEMFTPDIANSQTPDESSGYGWLTKPEIGKLPLHPGFKDAWDAVSRSRENTTIGKCAVRRVDISGQVTWEHPDPCPCHNAPGGGGPTKWPHDVNDIWHSTPDTQPCSGDLCEDDAGRTSLTRGGGTGEHTDTFSGQRTQPPAPDNGTSGGEDDTRYTSFQPVQDERGGVLQGYMGGHWPEGGHGTGQPPVTSIGGPTSIGPTAASLGRRNKGDTEAAVMAQLQENFPDQALEWVPQATWSGPELVPLDQIDFHDMESWSAWHETDRVEHFEHIIRDGGDVNPVVMIKVPGHEHYRAVDGHHRTLACLRLNRPVLAWVGVVPFGIEHVALETHSSQESSGSSEGNQ